MSLFMPLSNNQYPSKPMAISSITSPADTSGSSEFEIISLSPSPSSSSSQSDTVTPPTGNSSTKSESLSPPLSHAYSTSAVFNYPMNNDKSGKRTSLPKPYYYGYPYDSNGNHDSKFMTNSVSEPLSLQERRLRNKTASAKYRAKKNQQHCEMRSMISTLSKENELLLRQLDHVKSENEHLKTTCDKLRGKIIAQKMLRQYLVEEQQRQMKQPSCFSHYSDEEKKSY